MYTDTATEQRRTWTMWRAWSEMEMDMDMDTDIDTDRDTEMRIDMDIDAVTYCGHEHRNFAQVCTFMTLTWTM